MDPALEAKLPLVTVGIPTFNRQWSLPDVLAALLKLDYEKKRLRLCFVDNFSADGSEKTMSDFKRDHESEYEGIIIRVARTNIPEARNEILRLAAGTDYIFFLDSDAIPPQDAIPRLLASFRRDPAVGIAAIPFETNAPRRTGSLERAFVTPPGPHFAYKVGTGCCIYSMEAVGKVGTFNEKLLVHEDSEYCFRLRKAGFKIVSDPTPPGLHLRRYELGPGYYFRFMADSARTYRELIARGSAAHVAKVASSVVLVLSLLAAALFASYPALLLFAATLLFAAALNSAAFMLDDGIHVRALYRPVIGVLLTVATVGISFLVILGFPHRRDQSGSV